MKRLFCLCLLLAFTVQTGFAGNAENMNLPVLDDTRHRIVCLLQGPVDAAPTYLAVLRHIDGEDVEEEQILLQLPYPLPFQVMEKDVLTLEARKAVDKKNGMDLFVHSKDTTISYELTPEEQIPDDSQSEYPILLYSKYFRQPDLHIDERYTVEGLYLGSEIQDGMLRVKLEIRTANNTLARVYVLLRSQIDTEGDRRLAFKVKGRGSVQVDGQTYALFEQIPDTPVQADD